MADLKFYRNPFFIIVVVAAILLFTGQLMFSAYNYRSFTERSADNALISQTSSQASLLGEHLMFVASQSLVSTSLLQDETSTASQDIVAALQDFLQLNDLIQGAGIGRITGSGNGIYAYKTQDGVRTVNLNPSESQAYFDQIYQKAAAGKDSSIRWNSETTSLLGQSNIVSAIVPVYVKDVQIGYSRLDISVDALQQYVSAIKIGDTGYAFIAHDKSDFEKYLARSEPTPAEIISLGDISQKADQSDQPGFYRTTLAGHNQNIAIASIGATGLKMVYILPQEEAYAGINGVLIQSFLSLFFSFLAFFIFFYVIMQRNIDTPIGDLIKTVHALSFGDSSAPQRYAHRNNEQMSVLLDSIVSMPRNILKLVDELKDKNREVLAQRDEIGALYEKTAAMNDELFESIKEKEKLYLKLQDSYLDTVHALANAIEASDHYTQGHCQRVKDYSMAIARAMDIDTEDLQILEYAALLHDVGKIGIKPTILNKNAELDQTEYQVMAQHPQIGFHILEGIDFLEKCRVVVLQHHEHFDGGGYPNSLRGEDISLFSRMITVADSYDAMTSSRPYRSTPLSKEAAEAELVKNRGKQFDPRIVDIFIQLLNTGL